MIRIILREIATVVPLDVLLGIIILGFLFWIKFNDLAHIGIWQKKHEERSEEIWDKVGKSEIDIEGLKKGKVDK